MKYLIIFLLFITGPTLFGQTTSSPEIGQQIPNFVFKDVDQYSYEDLSSQSIIGKHTILYFWAKNCGGCIASMPKINLLQKQFKEDLQIALIGYLDKEEAIKPLYKKIKEKNKLSLTVAFDSTTFNKLSPGGGVPLLIWIDDLGIVKAITRSSELNKESVEKFINDEPFQFVDESETGLKRRLEALNAKTSLLVDVNNVDDTTLLFRSVLTDANPKLKPYSTSNIVPPKHEVINVPLLLLFQLAYFEDHGFMPNSMYQFPVYEIRDTSIFKYERGGNMKGLYSYSLMVSKDKSIDKKRMMQIMQSDLQNYFNIQVAFENRLMPCLKLKILDDKKISSLFVNGNPTPSSKWDKNLGGTLINSKISDAMSVITMSLADKPRVYNETGLDRNISIQLNAYMRDLDQIRKGLKAYGLDLIPSTELMRVMVFKDKL